MSFESARFVAAVVAAIWLVVGIPLGLYFWVRVVRHMFAIQRFRARRVKASAPDTAFATLDEREHFRVLARDAGRFTLCVVPPVAIAVLFDLN